MLETFVVNELAKQAAVIDDDVTGGALVWEHAVVHLAAFGTVQSAGRT